MKEKKRLPYAIVILIVQSIIAIFSFSIVFNHKEFLVKCVTIVITIGCIIHVWWVSEGKYQTNILFAPYFYNTNTVALFVLFCIMGSTSVVFQFYFGHIYRFHHIINNILTIPFALTSIIKYVSKLDKKFNAIDIVNKYENSFFLKLTPTILQSSLLYAVSFLQEQERNPAKIRIWGLYITADGINLLYMTVVLFLFVVCLIYIVGYFVVSKQTVQHSYVDLFPKWPITGVALFFMFWGCMAFYETDNRIEITYYFSIVFTACAILILSILMWMKLDTHRGCITLIYSFALSIILVVYGTVILYLESIGFSKVKTEGATIYSTLTIMILITIAIIVVICLFITKITDKYWADTKNALK